MVLLRASLKASPAALVWGKWGYSIHSGFILVPWLESWAQLGHQGSWASPLSYGLLTCFVQQSSPLFILQFRAFKPAKVKAPRPFEGSVPESLLLLKEGHEVRWGWKEIHRAWVLKVLLLGGLETSHHRLGLPFSPLNPQFLSTPFSVPCVSGDLPKPTNVTFISINMKNILQWNPPEGLRGVEVSYTVQYFM